MFQKIIRYPIRAMAVGLALTALVGCGGQSQYQRSSLVDYLYPKESEKVVDPSLPQLTLPLNVGIAFVPETRLYNSTLSEERKTELLERVAERFSGKEFVANIRVIPSVYLQPGGSFTNLDQLGRLYDLDIFALVSYDQTQFTDEDALALTYWTIVGAYFVAGEKNDTQTLMDTAVYDIGSRSLLFRAPGTSRVRGRAVPINLSEELREDSLEGFEIATGDMIGNLESELERFTTALEDNPALANVEYSEGYSGGPGAVGPASLVALLIPVFIRARSRSQANAMQDS